MKNILYALALFIGFQYYGYAQLKSTEVSVNSIGGWSLLVEGGATFSKTDYSGIGNDILGRFSLEYQFPSSTQSSFGLKFWAGGGYITGSDITRVIKEFRTGFKSFGIGMLYGLNFTENSSFYLLAGISSFSFDPKGENGVKLPNNALGNYNTSEIDYNGEIGIRLGITDNLRFVLSSGVNFSTSDNFDDITSGLKNDIFITTMAGLSFKLSSKKDDDNDGVENSEDICPDTPAGIVVDDFGCPLDSDKDGVADYLDKCPKTPQKVVVDKQGCPVDSDKDGIADYADLCPDTPKGIKVDDFGCPFDIDADGVPDYKDKCLNTPEGVSVDKNGCPIDTDLDGVPDYKDKCPNTRHGMIVNENGCMKTQIKQKNKSTVKVLPNVKTSKKIKRKTAPKIKINYDNFIISVDNNFIPGKSTLLRSAYARLEGLVSYMKKNLFYRYRIESYTDNVGSSDRNKLLSLQRANSILNYFVRKGIVKQRFKVVGLGENFPVASNKTEKGRAKNRRIVIVRTY